MCLALGLVAFGSLAIPGSAADATGRDDRLGSGEITQIYKTIGEVKLAVTIQLPEAWKPADRRPAIVFFFGGGWTGGSTAQFENHARYLASRGMVAMCADYRVRSRHGVKAAACVADAKSAVRWIRANAARLGIDPKRVAAGGGSAGGHLAAATAVLPGLDDPADHLSVSCVPDALVLFNPALVLAPAAGADLRGFLERATADRFGCAPEEISPLHHLRSGLPPTITFHGLADATVPYSTSELFATRSRALGNQCELVGAEGQSHGYFNFGRAGDRYALETLEAADRFLNSLGWVAGEPTVRAYFAAHPAVAFGSRAPEPATPVWMLTYFRQRYDSRVEIDASGRISNVPLPDPMKVEQLHLALSSDGRHWRPLNGNRPVWDQRLRDPFVMRGPDGLWHLLATGRAKGTGRGVRGPVCLHAVSPDLVTWRNPESLTLMAGAEDESGRPARNIWAPEWYWDEATGEAVLLWSSSFEDAGWKQSRLWWSRTRDWKTFTPAQVLFAPPYSVIDGTLVKHEGTYFLFHKEEEFGAATGERRAIRLATSRRLEGPYEVFAGPLNGGQLVPTITEGPSVMPDPMGRGWLLAYDFCMSNGYGASSSPDLYHWSVEEGVVFPPDARHGSLSRLTAAEAERLTRAFPAGN